MLDLKNLIDPRRLGEKKILVDVVDVYEFKDGKRTDRHIGYRYVVALPAHKFEKLGVRIEGETPLIELKGSFPEVQFVDLELYPYELNGTITISAKAAGIKAIEAKP